MSFSRKLREAQPLFELLVLIAVGLGMHYAILLQLHPEFVYGGHYALFELYGYFSALAFTIIFLLMLMRRKNLDSVGNTFMLLTCAQLFVAYLMLRPLLESTAENASAQKANFFAVFGVFLIAETVVSVRMLNKS